MSGVSKTQRTELERKYCGGYYNDSTSQWVQERHCKRCFTWLLVIPYAQAVSAMQVMEDDDAPLVWKIVGPGGVFIVVYSPPVNAMQERQCLNLTTEARNPRDLTYSVAEHYCHLSADFPAEERHHEFNVISPDSVKRDSHYVEVVAWSAAGEIPTMAANMCNMQLDTSFGLTTNQEEGEGNGGSTGSYADAVIKDGNYDTLVALEAWVRCEKKTTFKFLLGFVLVLFYGRALNRLRSIITDGADEEIDAVGEAIRDLKYGLGMCYQGRCCWHAVRKPYMAKLGRFESIDGGRARTVYKELFRIYKLAENPTQIQTIINGIYDYLKNATFEGMGVYESCAGTSNTIVLGSGPDCTSFEGYIQLLGEFVDIAFGVHERIALCMTPNGCARRDETTTTRCER